MTTIRSYASSRIGRLPQRLSRLGVRLRRRGLEVFRSFDSENHRFSAVKRLTNGYLSSKVYRRISDFARTAPAGAAIDIGPAQGGSTISIGLGFAAAGKNDRIYSFDRFEGSAAMAHGDDQAENVLLFRANVAKFGLADRVEVIVVNPDGLVGQVPDSARFGFFFIDADGALDRDFGFYYDRLAPGGHIALDDCVNTINRNARETYLRWEYQDELDAYVKKKGLGSFREVCPLGKEYTTWRLFQYFREAGYVEVVELVDGTMFARKPENGPRFDTEENRQAISAIRDEILAEYFHRRAAPLKVRAG